MSVERARLQAICAGLRWLSVEALTLMPEDMREQAQKSWFNTMARAIARLEAAILRLP